MAYGKRYRVGRIVGLWRLRKSADSFDHVHYLPFFGAPVACDGLLYLKRGVLVNFNSGFLAG